MAHDDIAPAAESGAARRQAFVTSFGARALTEGFDLDALLAEAAAHAAAGLGVERALVLQHRPEAGDLLVRAGVGWKAGVVGQTTLPTSMASPPGRALRTAAESALREGRIAGAGLDVFAVEPHPANPYVGFDNVVLTPHIGGSTVEAYERMVHLALTNVLNVLDGLPPHNQVYA